MVKLTGREFVISVSNGSMTPLLMTKSLNVGPSPEKEVEKDDKILSCKRSNWGIYTICLAKLSIN